jgi:hypothetical protein
VQENWRIAVSEALRKPKVSTNSGRKTGVPTRVSLWAPKRGRFVPNLHNSSHLQTIHTTAAGLQQQATTSLAAHKVPNSHDHQHPSPSSGSDSSALVTQPTLWLFAASGSCCCRRLSAPLAAAWLLSLLLPVCCCSSSLISITHLQTVQCSIVQSSTV